MSTNIPHGIFTKARLIARGVTESEIHQAIKQKLIVVRRDGTLQSRAPKLSVGGSVNEDVEIPSGTTVQQIKNGKPVRRQVVKRNGSKYSVIDPDTKQIDDVDEKDIAIVNDDDKNAPGTKPMTPTPAVKESREQYENYYDDGGHGGPYQSVADAITSAKQFLAKGVIRSGKGTYIVEVRPYSSSETGGYGSRHEGSLYVCRVTSHDGEGTRITDAQGNEVDGLHETQASAKKAADKVLIAPDRHTSLADSVLDEASKYLVWIDEGEGAGWEEQGDGPLTLKQAERISREIRKECGCKVKYLPVGQKPTVSESPGMESGDKPKPNI